MFKVFISAQAIRPTSHCTALTSRLLREHLSTNSAIARGVRKSRTRPNGKSASYQNDESLQKTLGQHGRSKQPDTARIRRPNHQQKQDIEDMEESARLRAGRLTPRQRNYLQGGRKPSARTPFQDNSYQSSERRSPRGLSFNERSKNSSKFIDEEYPQSSQRKGRPAPEADSYIQNKPSAYIAHGSGRLKSFERIPTVRRREYVDADGDAPKTRISGYSNPRIAPNGAYDSDRSKSANFSSSYRKESNYGSEGGRTERRRTPNRRNFDIEEEPVMQNQDSNDWGHTEKRSHRKLGQDLLSEERSFRGIKVPLSIPYTTPASEFLYGSSVVTAALKTVRRRLYKLYVYDGEHRDGTNQDKSILQLARSQGINISKVQRDWLPLMDKMSAGRPHNGYILEASPLPKLPVTGLQLVQGHQTAFHVILDHQTKEDVIVNGKDTIMSNSSKHPRYPIVLMLDGILDPGNLGGILRSAYFLGIDAVAISSKHSSPLTPIALKASAGASESIPLLSFSHPAAFVEQSQANGWKFYAAVTGGTQAQTNQVRLTTSELDAPTVNHPCVLILGGEGEGLRWGIQKKADFLLSIEGYRSGKGGVDSLNVSVAAGLLCEAFLRRPLKPLDKKTVPLMEAVEEVASKEVTLSKEALF